MYGLPEPVAIKSEVFARVPEQYQTKRKTPPQRLGIGGTTLEAPSFDRAGNLYITDIPHGRIFKIAPDGTMTLAIEYDGEPNGLKIHKDGRIFVADFHHGLMLFDPAAGKMTPLCSGIEKEYFKGVNDLVFARNGDLYFTDQGATGLHDPTGRVYRMDTAGRLSVLIDTVPSPNGIVLDREETSVYVAVTRASEVWNLPLSDRGTVIKAGMYARLPVQGPDGMAIDAEGNVAVAHPFMGVVWLFNRIGLPIARVDSCAGRFITNVAYGGPGNRWIYMVEGETYSVLRAEMPHPGHPMFSHV